MFLYSIRVFIYKTALLEVPVLFDYEGAHIRNLFLLLVAKTMKVEEGSKL